MKIRVIRQACCAADDQVGPLDAEYVLADTATLAELADQIRTSRFLQFSSTHNRISGEIGGLCVLTMFPADGPPTEFHVSPDALVCDVVGNRTLFFYFRHV